jgi:hypothetical protein
MFRITFFVEDAKLGEAFKRLAGLARNVEHAYVPNAEPAKGNGKVRPTSADTLDLLTKELHKRRIETFRGPDLKHILTDVGLATSGYSHHLQKLVEAGVIKKGKVDKTGQGHAVTFNVVK